MQFLIIAVLSALLGVIFGVLVGVGWLGVLIAKKGCFKIDDGKYFVYISTAEGEEGK